MNSKRLLAIAALIDKEDRIVDIGCDHAYLDIYLVKNNLCKKVIASDISKGALNQAIVNIKKHGLSKEIETIISDGLKNIDCNIINTIVISGMGTQTILNILQSDKIKSIKKIIIQSNNNLTLLRQCMSKKGYIIKKEVAVLENDKYYDIILFVPGYKKLNLAEKLIGLFNEENTLYYEHLYKKNKAIIDKIPKLKFAKRLKLYVANHILKKYLKSSL